MEQPEILRADPQRRRQAIAMVTSAAMLGIVAIQWILPWSETAIAQAVRDGMPRSVVCKATLVVLTGVGISVAAFGTYVVRLGRGVTAERRFPPLGTRVIHDTRVVTGRPAELLGRVQTFLGAALIVLAAVLVVMTSYGLVKLIG